MEIDPIGNIMEWYRFVNKETENNVILEIMLSYENDTC